MKEVNLKPYPLSENQLSMISAFICKWLKLKHSVRLVVVLNGPKGIPPYVATSMIETINKRVDVVGIKEDTSYNIHRNVVTSFIPR